MKKFLLKRQSSPGDASSPSDIKRLLAGFLLYNEADYLNANPDVRQAVQKGDFLSGFAHFQQYGNRENRFPGYNGFQWDDYISANADLASFRSDPNPEARARAHFKEKGYAEGRKLRP